LTTAATLTEKSWTTGYSFVTKSTLTTTTNLALAATLITKTVTTSPITNFPGRL